MHDSLYCGKTFRTLNIIDEGTRECLAIEVDSSLPAARVIRVLEQLKEENGFVERFNGSFRREFLNVYLFETLTQVRDMAWVWMLDYNDERPHDSLGKLPPAAYRQKLESSSLELSH